MGTIQELLELERRFWNAMQSKDGSTASDMTDDGCIIVGAQGVSVIDAQKMRQLTAEGKWTLHEYTFDTKTMQARFITDDVAVVGYKVTEHVTIDGESLNFDANDSSVWVRRNGKWMCALHTESLAGDPFGRDKRK